MQSQTFGDILRSWRKVKRHTQLSLAMQVQSSTRHLSFLETGRSMPSREMIATLAEALEVPLAGRNEMLMASGFAPIYPSTQIDESDAEPIRRAMRFLLRRHHPYPAFVIDPGWTIAMANDAYVQFGRWLRGQAACEPDAENVHAGPPVEGSNPIVSVFEDDSVRSSIRNFDAFASALISHLEALARTEEAAAATLARIRPNAPAAPPCVAGKLPVVIPLVVKARGLTISLFSTVTMLGTSRDTVLSSLRVETQFPADQASDSALRAVTTGDARAW